VTVTSHGDSDSDRLMISDSDMRLIISDSFSDRLSLHLYFRETGWCKEGDQSLLRLVPVN
jgi:hypothetical protein